MTTIRLTMAQALVRWLMAQRTEIDGVEVPLFPGVFAIFGHGNVTCLSEALEAVKDELPTWRGQNEQSMALAAIGFAKAKARRQIMVATSSIGPGATNMVTAAGVAHTNRLPVLLLSGDYYVSRLPDPVLQQVEHWGDPTHQRQRRLQAGDPLLGPDHPARAADPVTAAGARASSSIPADCGPAFLGLCQDVQAEAFDYPARFFEKRVHHIPRPRPDVRQLEQAAALLRSARKPLLIAGGGVRYSGAEAALGEFATRHRVPVVETIAGRTVLVHDHPMNAGPDRRARLGLGQPSGGRGRRGPGGRHPAAGLHHRLLVAVRGRRAVHRPERRPVRRPQAPGAARGRRRPGRAGRAGRGAARLAGAGILARRRAAGLWRMERLRRPAQRADQRRAADLRPCGGCHQPPRRPARPGADRGRRHAGRAVHELAGQGVLDLRLRVRLLLHGLRDRRRLGGQARRSRRATSSSWSATAAI